MVRLRSFVRFLAVIGALAIVSAPTTARAAEMLGAGQRAPAFDYTLLDGHTLSHSALRGHPYIVWMVASWCPSCQTGSGVVGEHIDFLRSHGVLVVEMQLAKDLGGSGPGLQTFQKAVGMRAASPNWYWGELSDAQTAVLDPKGYPDMYYLVDGRGTIVAVDGNPATTWDRIATFAASASAKHAAASRRHR